MTSDQTSGPLPRGVVLEEMSIEEAMRVYDSLPPRFRELYDSMPMKMNPVEFGQVIQTYGYEAGYVVIKDLINSLFPGWNGGVIRRSRSHAP